MSAEQPKPGTDSDSAGAERSAASPMQPVEKELARESKGDVSKLTAEEQMTAFEEDLKENDWGHQPC